MAQAEIPNNIKRILKTSAVLIFISTFLVVFVGGALARVHNEVKTLEAFMENAKDTQPNFEKSLELYTDQTKSIIEYLLNLRPASKEEYIKFIGEVEAIGQDLSLNIDLTSIENNDPKATLQDSIDYSIKFYGSESNMVEFLKELEMLPYFIKITEATYDSPKFQEDEEKARENVNIKIKLYIK